MRMFWSAKSKLHIQWWSHEIILVFLKSDTSLRRASGRCIPRWSEDIAVALKAFQGDTWRWRPGIDDLDLVQA
jgi:hypothetical protein